MSQTNQNWTVQSHLSRDSEDFVHPMAELIAAQDFSFAHDDSCENIFSKAHLGRINWRSGWEMANILRYGCAANAVLKSPACKTGEVKILDVGSSHGGFYTFLLTSYSGMGMPKVDYLGLEVREDVVEKANKTNQGTRNKFKIMQWDCIKRELKELRKKFDVILMSEILEHMPRKQSQKYLRQARNMLNPGGTVVVTSPNPKKHEDEEFVWPESHVYEYPLHEMVKSVVDAGFLVVNANGWLGKSRYQQARMTDEELDLYNKLVTISSGFATAVMALVRPELAECYVLVCQVKDEMKGKKLKQAVVATEQYGKLLKREVVRGALAANPDRFPRARVNSKKNRRVDGELQYMGKNFFDN